MSMTPTDQPKRMGRPAKADIDRKSVTMRFRVRELLRDRLEAKASEAGRTVNEEAEIRLENSFNLEPIHRLIFSEPATASFFMNIANVVATVQQHRDAMGNLIGSADWQNHDFTRAALRSALAVLIEHAIPEPRDASKVARQDASGLERPLTPLERNQYASAIEYMRGFGKEYAEVLTGQRPDIVEALDRGGASEH